MARKKIALIGAGNIGGTLAHLAALDVVALLVQVRVQPAFPLPRPTDQHEADDRQDQDDQDETDEHQLGDADPGHQEVRAQR